MSERVAVYGSHRLSRPFRAVWYGPSLPNTDPYMPLDGRVLPYRAIPSATKCAPRDRGAVDSADGTKWQDSWPNRSYRIDAEDS
jgi:hypothetical protein